MTLLNRQVFEALGEENAHLCTVSCRKRWQDHIASAQSSGRQVLELQVKKVEPLYCRHEHHKLCIPAALMSACNHLGALKRSTCAQADKSDDGETLPVHRKYQRSISTVVSIKAL